MFHHAPRPQRKLVKRFVGLAFGLLAWGCANERNQPGWSGQVESPTKIPQIDAGHHQLACIPATAGARPHECGNYDNRSCNSTDCHKDMFGGGWVYTDRKGPPFLGEATITIYDVDGSIITAVSGEDGFFQIKDEVKPPYKVCASECPGTNCSLTAHPNADCQTSNCHGKPGQKIYVSNMDLGTLPVDGGFGNCTPPATVGPYMHTEQVFGNQPCSTGGCHRAPKPVFQGGFLYDGPTSNNTVSEATITITPSSGTVTKLVTGVTGMFFVGTLGDKTTAITLTPPFTVCVKKCSTSVCSPTNGHTTTSDCQTSGCHDSERKLYLR